VGAGRWVPLVLLAAGVGLVGDAILQGGATVAIVVVLPVIFGASTEFLLGVVLLLVGFVTLPLAMGWTLASEETDAGPAPARREVPPAEVGGLILIGPIPLFFGRWRGMSRRIRVAVALAGALLLLALLGLLWVAWR